MFKSTEGTREFPAQCFCIGRQHINGEYQPHCPCIMRQIASKTPTPAKGEPMPQTREYWEKRAESDAELMLQMRDEMARLRQKINKLEQRK